MCLLSIIIVNIISTIKSLLNHCYHYYHKDDDDHDDDDDDEEEIKVPDQLEIENPISTSEAFPNPGKWKSSP